jgi:hypothetical protein
MGPWRETERDDGDFRLVPDADQGSTVILVEIDDESGTILVGVNSDEGTFASIWLPPALLRRLADVAEARLASAADEGRA